MAPADDAVVLDLRLADGTFLNLADFRGRPLLVFVFTTYDAGSQSVLLPLQCLREQRPDVVQVGIAAQPSARLLIPTYIDVIEPPFVTSYDPTGTVREGTSALGPIPGVPAFLAIDARGSIRAHLLGFAECDALVDLVDQAR
ncbi:MAG: TlpA family protein disulfide reductase [Sandaracinaceae bacterium]